MLEFEADTNQTELRKDADHHLAVGEGGEPRDIERKVERERERERDSPMVHLRCCDGTERFEAR